MTGAPVSGGSSARTTVTRLRERASTDRAALDALLDEVHVGHVASVDDTGGPVVVPTIVARDGDRLLVHGSTGSGWMRRVAAGGEVCVAVTALDALVVARSAFESSMRYRSAVLFGRCSALSGEEKLRGLDRLTEAVLPGRTSEVRRPTAKELDATVVLALPIEQWSLKASAEWPDDPPGDVAGAAWAGVVPVRPGYGPPLAAPDLRPGIPVPASVLGLPRS